MKPRHRPGGRRAFRILVFQMALASRREWRVLEAAGQGKVFHPRARVKGFPVAVRSPLEGARRAAFRFLVVSREGAQRHLARP